MSAAVLLRCFYFIEAGVTLFVFEVLHLSGDEPEAAGSQREVAHQYPHRVTLRRLAPGNKGKCLGQQGVTREHRNAFAEDFVVCRFSAP